MWKNTQKRDHAKKISVKSHSKNLPIQLLQMHDFIFLGHFWIEWSKWNWKSSIQTCIHSKKYFHVYELNQRYLVPKIGQLWELITFEHIRPDQVFQHQMVAQTLLYWNQLKPLAQICPKINDFNFIITNLQSKMSI